VGRGAWGVGREEGTPNAQRPTPNDLQQASAGSVSLYQAGSYGGGSFSFGSMVFQQGSTASLSSTSAQSWSSVQSSGNTASQWHDAQGGQGADNYTATSSLVYSA
jgi:hypothetical protein